MKKKVISLVLALAAVFSVAGCGTKDTQTAEDIPTLRWLLPCDAQDDLQTVEDAMNEIFVKEVGAKVKLEFIDQGAFTEKMRMKMASGEDFDMCFTGWVNNYTTAAKGGGIMDITDLIDKVDGLREAVPDYLWEAASINGKIYGVPNVQIATSSTAVVIYDDVAKDYDFDFSSMKHIEDVEPYLEMIKAKDPSYYPYLPAYGMLPWIDEEYTTIGTAMLALPKESTSADDLVYLWETDVYKRGAAKLHEWYKKGYIRPDILSAVDDSNDRKSGNIAVDQELWKPGVELAWGRSYNRDCKFYTVVEPALTRSMSLSTCVSLGNNCKDPEKALAIIKLMHTNADLVNLISFGVEGKHYEMKDNRVQPIENSGYDQNADVWKFGNEYIAHLVEGQSDTEWEDTKKVNETAFRPPTLGFSFDNTAVKTECAALNTIYTEYEVRNKGAEDPDSYTDEFVRKMKDAGIEKVYDEVKRQLEEYFAAEK